MAARLPEGSVGQLPFGRAAAAGVATPVVLVAGDAASGTGALLHRVLAQDAFRSSLVITNDARFDHPRVVRGGPLTSASSGACICCTVRTDLQHMLTDLHRRRRIGAIEDFDRVIIDVSDVDPAAVIQTLILDADLARLFRLARICSVIDAVTFSAHASSLIDMKRIVLADTLLMVGAGGLAVAARESLEEAMRRLNPLADVVWAGDDDAMFDRLSGSDADQVPLAWTDDGLTGEDSRAHGIRVFSLTPDQPFQPGAAETFLDTLTRLRGADLLRFRGLFAIEGEDRPLFVQGVHHVFEPPRFLARWPGNDRRSRLMFATRNLRRETVAGLLAPFLDRELFVTPQ